MNLNVLLRQRLAESRRPPDGLLHPSGDLLGSLRHAQLRLAGAPTIESQIVSDTRLMTGTMWHRFLGEMLVRSGVPYMQEVSVTPGLPTGWSGTADAVFWHPEYRGFVLGDFKTIKGEGMKWVLKDGAKEEHLWQLSAYWHALYNMGLPLVRGFGVWYLPQNDTTERDELIEPVLMECEPLPRELVWGVMEDRWDACEEYLYERELPSANGFVYEFDRYLNDKLAPEMARVQKLYLDGKKNQWDVKLVPHWSSQFCPYRVELCGCSEQGTTKIGHYTLEGKYEPRKGYEDELPMVEPSPSEYRKQRAKAEAEGKEGESEAGRVLAGSPAS
ncbi:MAG: hypothetical protein KGL39_15285 [Patescibacteria group bacterium]|nr:hypothetical protein [Patescibacteria group bacterium]